MNPVHHQNQDTNDRFLANIQRNGTFSVIPRISAGEITPEGLIAIGQVAKKYGLYTKVNQPRISPPPQIVTLPYKITGGQRIDMFGAQKADLPDIWEGSKNIVPDNYQLKISQCDCLQNSIMLDLKADMRTARVFEQ